MKIIGITGGSGSGKTTLANKLSQLLPLNTAVLRLDSYYHDHSDISPTERNNLNFDHPDAIDFALIIKHVQQLREGKSVDCPVYSFLTHCRLTKTQKIHPPDVLILEGLLLLNFQKLLPFFDRTFYIQVPDPLRLQRIIERDCMERGRTITQIEERFHSIVNPMHKRFVEPVMKKVDHVIDNHKTEIALKQLQALLSNI